MDWLARTRGARRQRDVIIIGPSTEQDRIHDDRSGQGQHTREIKKQCEWNNHAWMDGCLALAWPHLLLLLLDSDASPSHYPVQARGAVTVTGRGCCLAFLSSSFNFPFCPDQTALASAHPATPPLHNLHTPALRPLHQPSFFSLSYAR